jgi:hypothetical protein
MYSYVYKILQMHRKKYWYVYVDNHMSEACNVSQHLMGT